MDCGHAKAPEDAEFFVTMGKQSDSRWSTRILIGEAVAEEAPTEPAAEAVAE
jgi:hypothetical protein